MASAQKQYDIVIAGGGSAGIGMAASLKKCDANLKIAVIEPSLGSLNRLVKTG
jgi:sulfide:quinone oxidoreductase